MVILGEVLKCVDWKKYIMGQLLNGQTMEFPEYLSLGHMGVLNMVIMCGLVDYIIICVTLYCPLIVQRRHNV